jgi:segregation and condensation protein B
MDDDKKAVLEAALFVAEDPLDTDRIADILNLGSKGYVQMVVDELKEDLQEDHRGLEIIETDDGYRMQVKKDHIDQVRDLAPHQDLTDATLRTLSIIAYNAPVKQSKIIEIRGNRAYNQIGDLEDRGLLSSEKDGRTKILDVTEEFLEYFGIESLDEFRDSLDAEPAAEELLDDDELEEDEEDGETGTDGDVPDGDDGTDETDIDPDEILDDAGEDVEARSGSGELLSSDGSMD